MADEEIEDKGLKQDSFTYGTPSSTGAFKAYLNLDKPIEELQKDIDKIHRVLKIFQAIGFCRGKE